MEMNNQKTNAWAQTAFYYCSQTILQENIDVSGTTVGTGEKPSLLINCMNRMSASAEISLLHLASVAHRPLT